MNNQSHPKIAIRGALSEDPAELSKFQSELKMLADSIDWDHMDLRKTKGALPICLNWLWDLLKFPRIKIDKKPWVYFSLKKGTRK